jgi:predicted enzyme related to lactoylglutathione lyase
MSPHALHWFEIPAADLTRAFTFYHAVLDGHVRMGTFGGAALALFDVPFHTGAAVGGSIVQRDGMTPGMDGALLYLNLFGPLAAAVARVVPAGGTVLADRIPLGSFGTAAIIRDSEGNRIGLLEPPAA